MRNKAAWFCAGLLAASLTATAQQRMVQIEFPADSPVTVVSADWGPFTATPRGGALVVDLHTSLRLRNASQRSIRGVTLLVLAQNFTPGGKASVSVPSLNVAPGEVFPIRVDLRLLRPLRQGTGPLVRVSLDGVLFDDLSFYGPNRLHCRRSMTVWELEARRDRRYFKQTLAARGPEGLRREVLLSLARQADRPRLGVHLARGGRATNTGAGHDIQFAFLRFPDAPVEPLSGVARMVDREASRPRLKVLNRSRRTVRHVVIGWILKDNRGRRFLAGSLPADVSLAPGRTGNIAAKTVLRFSRPIHVAGMAGFVSHVEFDNGEIWIPSRKDLATGNLDRLLAPSPEEQRLTNLYRKKGLKALVAELNKF